MVRQLCHNDMPILIEGYSVQTILELPTQDVDELVLTGESIVLSAGSAEVLGSFTLLPDRMVVELADGSAITTSQVVQGVAKMQAALGGATGQLKYDNLTTKPGSVDCGSVVNQVLKELGLEQIDDFMDKEWLKKKKEEMAEPRKRRKEEEGSEER